MTATVTVLVPPPPCKKCGTKQPELIVTLDLSEPRPPAQN
jgi:hypothetical protein